MIHVVTIHNQHLYARQLDEMFRMRHEFYVKQRGWESLTSENNRETDEFDNEADLRKVAISLRDQRLKKMQEFRRRETSPTEDTPPEAAPDA